MRCGPRAACNTRRRSADRNVIRKADRLPSGFSFQGMVTQWHRRKFFARSRAEVPLSTIRKSAGFSSRRWSSSCWWRASGGSSTTSSRTCTRLHIASGFGFLKGRAGFDISDSAIAYSSDSHLWPCHCRRLINTLIVAVAGIITATIIGFIIGIGRLVAQLADPQDLHGLCRGLPQHPAAAGDLLLVFRRAGGAARAARKHQSAVRLLSQPARLLFSARCLGRRLLADLRRLACRHRHGVVRRPHGAPAADGDRPAISSVLDLAGADRRPAVARLCAERFSADLRFSEAIDLQPDRRLPGQAGVPVALSGAVLLHGRLHRRDRARRHSAASARARPRRQERWGCGRDRSCGLSSCRRPCASSSRR